MKGMKDWWDGGDNPATASSTSPLHNEHANRYTLERRHSMIISQPEGVHHSADTHSDSSTETFTEINTEYPDSSKEKDSSLLPSAPPPSYESVMYNS